MNHYLPIVAACASTALGGAVAVATRAIIDQVDPVSMGVIRYGIAVLCLVPVALWFGNLKFERQDYLPLTALGIMFFAIFPVGFALSLKYTTAGQGALVLSLMPVLNMTFSAVLKREIITRKKVIGALFIVVGVGMVVDLSADQSSDTVFGNLVMFAMAVLGAMFNTLARPYLQRYDQLQATAWFMLSGWVTLFVVTTLTGQFRFELPPLETWWVLLLIGTLGGAVPIFLFNWALGHIESSLVSVALGLNPLTAAILGVLLLSEPFSLSLVMGLACVLAGITFANYRGQTYDATRNPVSPS